MWLNNTTATQATYYGQTGHSYAFYSVATDSGGDVETAPAAADRWLSIVLPGGTTIGLYNPTTSTYFLRNSNTTGFPPTPLPMVPANSNLITIIGDWNGDGADTIGLYNPDHVDVLPERQQHGWFCQQRLHVWPCQQRHGAHRGRLDRQRHATPSACTTRPPRCSS